MGNFECTEAQREMVVVAPELLPGADSVPSLFPLSSQPASILFVQALPQLSQITILDNLHFALQTECKIYSYINRAWIWSEQ